MPGAGREPRPAASTPPAQPRRPNIVFVLVDDMRWDDLGAAGHPFIETPHMDRLAREGARFPNAFATTPLCSPSRASFLTGQYPHTNGIIDNTARPEPQPAGVSAASCSRPATAPGFFGKWHMGNDDSPRPGFDHWVAMPGQGEAIDPQLNVDGQRVQAKGYAPTCSPTTSSASSIGRRTRRSSSTWRTRRSIPTSSSATTAASTPLPGQPGGFVAAERHRGRYAGRPMPRRANAFEPPLDKPALHAADRSRCRRSARPPRRPTRRSAAASRCCSASTTASAASSRRSSARASLDDTIVVFTSDHGYFYGEHGLNEERRLAYEETIRIPLLVRYPRLAKAGIDAGGDGAEHRPGADAARAGRR